MEIFLAKHGGFCFGVKQAFNTAVKAAQDNQNLPIVTYGPLIHNQDVVDYLADKGVQVIESIDDFNQGTVIIRSHGVGEEFYQEANIRGIQVIDATCVFVKKVHRIVKDHKSQGHRIIICGDAKHPEVIGINGWTQNSASVVANLSEVQALQFDSTPICVVAQTTLNVKHWEAIIAYINTLEMEKYVFNTICSATRQRQEEAIQISQKVDFMLVIGGKSSSNTQKLYEIAKKQGINAQHIENVDEINVNFVQKYDKIGIVAGASTPDWVINEVILKLKSEGEVVVNGRQ